MEIHSPQQAQFETLGFSKSTDVFVMVGKLLISIILCASIGAQLDGAYRPHIEVRG